MLAGNGKIAAILSTFHHCGVKIASVIIQGKKQQGIQNRDRIFFCHEILFGPQDGLLFGMYNEIVIAHLHPIFS